MDIGIIATRYAKALMQFAVDSGQEEQIYHQVSCLSQQLERYKELREALENPILSLREKYQLLCNASSAEGKVSHEYSRFLTLVLHNKREPFLRFICLSFLNLYKQAHHIGVGRLTTATPISPEMAERIRQAASTITHSTIELATEVNPAIEGGFVFDINDYRLDASVATQLKRVKQQFIDKNRRIV